MNNTQKEKALVALYETLPKIECKKLCSECCGPFVMSRLEHVRIERHVGKCHATKILPVQVETGQSFPGLGRSFEQVTCPMLKDGLCSIYNLRPAICRLWGLTAKMKCPHGCEPERTLTEVEAFHFLHKAFELGL